MCVLCAPFFVSLFSRLMEIFTRERSFLKKITNRKLVLVNVTSIYPINLMFQGRGASTVSRGHLEFDAIFYNNCQERVALV